MALLSKNSNAATVETDGETGTNAATETPANSNAELERGPGQPSKYKPEYCAQVIEHMAENHGLTSFAGQIGVSFKTVYKWAAEIPEFADAVAIGKGRRLYVIENVLAKPKSGPQIAGAIFLAKNVGAEEYREKIEHSHEGLSAEGIATIADAMRLGVADAMRQLGAQSRQIMTAARIIDHGATLPVIEADFTEVPAPAAPGSTAPASAPAPVTSPAQ